MRRLERPHLRAHRRLRQVQLLGGLRHAALADDGPEVEQVVIVQPVHRLPRHQYRKTRIDVDSLSICLCAVRAVASKTVHREPQGAPMSRYVIRPPAAPAAWHTLELPDVYCALGVRRIRAHRRRGAAPARRARPERAAGDGGPARLAHAGRPVQERPGHDPARRDRAVGRAGPHARGGGHRGHRAVRGAARVRAGVPRRARARSAARDGRAARRTCSATASRRSDAGARARARRRDRAARRRPRPGRRPRVTLGGEPRRSTKRR